MQQSFLSPSLIFPSQVALRNEAERLRELKAKIKLKKFLGKDRNLDGVAINIPLAREAMEKARAALKKQK